MTDLGTAGRRLLASQHDEPTPPEVLARRARQRRRTRRTTFAGAGALAVAAAAVGLILAGGDGSHVSVVGPPTPKALAPRAELRSPEALATAGNGDVLIDNLGTDQILRRSPGGVLRVLAGDGHPGFGGDGGPAGHARLNQPRGVTVGADGVVYVADTGNNRIRAIAPDGVITTVAGDGATTGPTAGVARHVAVGQPEALAAGPGGRVYLTDNAGVQVLSHGSIHTLMRAGPGRLTVHGQPTAWYPSQIAVSTTGDVYVSDLSPKLLAEFSPGGKLLHVWDREVSQLAAGSAGAVVVADEGYFSLDRITSGTLRPIVTFHRGTFPSLKGGFRPSGIAVTAGGTIYADTDGVNGGTTAPALVELRPGHHVQLLEPTPTAPHTSQAVLTPDGVGRARFTERSSRAIAALESALGRPADPRPHDERSCTVDAYMRWATVDAFFDRGRFVGYAASSRTLPTGAGLHVGDRVSRARRLYGSALHVSLLQGGSYTVRLSSGRIDGFLTGATARTVPSTAAIATIDAGAVGCPGVSP